MTIRNMRIQDISTNLSIPAKHLREMQKDGLISDPLTPKETDNLTFLSLFWGKKKWLKRQISRLSQSDRAELVEKAGLNKIESYIYQRLKSSKEKKERLTAQQIIKELSYYYEIPKEHTNVLKKVVIKMRNKVAYENRKIN